ncbi:MAG: ABC transporter ATP-binding protein, partial [Mesorhizobium sp.]
MVYVLALPELFYTVQVIYKRNLEVIPLLMVATIWYLIIMSVLSVIQLGIERRFSRGAVRTPSGPLLPAALAFLSGRSAVPATKSPPPAPAPVAAVRKPLVTAGEKLARRGIGRVEIRDVSKRFGALTVLDGVDLDVAPGSVTAIV